MSRRSILLLVLTNNVENKLVKMHKDERLLLVELQNPAKFANFHCTKTTK